MMGDIILVENVGKGSTFNLMGQRLLGGRATRDTRYTHVAVSAGPFEIIHAMPSPRDVEFALIHELIPPDAVFSAWRSSPIAESLRNSDRKSVEFYSNMLNCAGMAYNAIFIFNELPDYAFCSQLAAQILTGMAAPLSKDPLLTMPIDVAEYMTTSDDWFQVTDEYVALISTDENYKHMYMAGEQKASESWAAYFHAKNSWNKFAREMHAMMNKSMPASYRLKNENNQPINTGVWIDMFGRSFYPELSSYSEIFEGLELPGAPPEEYWPS